MKFYLKTSREYWGCRKKSVEIGIKELDEARKEVGCQFDAGLMRCYIEAFRTSPEAEISEEVARRSGHFSGCYKAEVKVPLGALNEFVERHLALHRTDNGEILSVWWEYKFNKENWIKAWEEKGFPLDWDVMPGGEE